MKTLKPFWVVKSGDLYINRCLGQVGVTSDIHNADSFMSKEQAEVEVSYFSSQISRECNLHPAHWERYIGKMGTIKVVKITMIEEES